MKYISTRGGAQPAEFCDILIEGLAYDGGLYVPESIPKIDIATLNSWVGLSYPELAMDILPLYITDIPKEDLSKIVNNTYNQSVFNNADIVPLKKFIYKGKENFYLLGLSEGPTIAFKDLPMQLLGNLFEYVLTKRNTHVNILGSTSGDTGSAAEYAFKGKKGVQVFMLSPYGRMSEFQKSQMYTLEDPNIHNLSVKGVFDECQDIVKAINGDLDFKKKHHIAAVNSINFARIAAQIVYYFWAWCASAPRDDEKTNYQIDITVPTGNFGNILAAQIAKMMGLPLRNLIVATNENNVLEDFFKSGVYKPRSPEQTYSTSSPSMDISKASNFERFVYFLLDCDSEKLNEYWAKLSSDGSFDLSEYKDEIALRYAFKAGMSSHQDRIATIKGFYEQTAYTLDPHTADGVKVASEFMDSDTPMFVAETALAAKFGPTIAEALGKPAAIPERFADLLDKKRHEIVMDNSVDAVKEYIASHA